MGREGTSGGVGYKQCRCCAIANSSFSAARPQYDVGAAAEECCPKACMRVTSTHNCCSFSYADAMTIWELSVAPLSTPTAGFARCPKPRGTRGMVSRLQSASLRRAPRQSPRGTRARQDHRVSKNKPELQVRSPWTTNACQFSRTRDNSVRQLGRPSRDGLAPLYRAESRRRTGRLALLTLPTRPHRDSGRQCWLSQPLHWFAAVLPAAIPMQQDDNLSLVNAIPHRTTETGSSKQTVSSSNP